MSDKEINGRARLSGLSEQDNRLVTVVIPVYNGEEYLARVLRPVCEARSAGDIWEIIIVDDGSTDMSAQIISQFPVDQLLRTKRKGPATARNFGTSAATGDWIWFIDSDVVIDSLSANLVTSVILELKADEVAFFGSYKDHTPAAGFFSTYENITHHWTHQNSPIIVDSFWAGCGVVQKAAFEEIGGFDAERYSRPCIEDIELGYRLTKAGSKVRVVKSLQVTHLKNWSFLNLVKTDIFSRALPWSELILEQKVSNQLNISTIEKFRAGLAVVSPIAFLLVVYLDLNWYWLLALLAVLLISNFRLFRFVQTKIGIFKTVGVFFFQQFFYIYSSLSFFCVYCKKRIIF